MSRIKELGGKDNIQKSKDLGRTQKAAESHSVLYNIKRRYFGGKGKNEL